VRTLTRHLLSEQLWLFAGALVVFFAIGTVAEILGHLGEIVDRRPDFGGALRALALRVSARYAGDAVPAASFTAVFLCLGLAGRRGEIQGLHTCGLASRQLAVPLLITAGALSWVTLLIDQTWLSDAPRGRSGPPPAAATRTASGPIWYHSGQSIYNAARRDADGSLRDLAIFDVDDRGRVVAATHVGVVPSDAQDWELDSAARTRFDPADPLWSATDTVEVGAVPLRGARSLTGAPGLTAPIARGQQAGAEARSQRLARHSRLAQAASVLVCALLALPLALGIGPGTSLARPALVGAAVLAIYLGLGAVGELASTRAWLPVWLGAWLSPALLSVAAVAALVRARR
jgi:lipopolysaccharide export LptBFGC system permease protein LptF